MKGYACRSGCQRQKQPAEGREGDVPLSERMRRSCVQADFARQGSERTTAEWGRSYNGGEREEIELVYIISLLCKPERASEGFLIGICPIRHLIGFRPIANIEYHRSSPVELISESKSRSR